MYYVLLPDGEARDRLLADLSDRQILAVFHYVPLHGSPAGERLGRVAGSLATTEDVAGRIARLPLYTGMTEDESGRVIEAVRDSVTARTHA
jgi:dTDP-4-amino-4,6-dideoxygalactose transaminase